jgi:hypothetical protein
VLSRVWEEDYVVDSFYHLKRNADGDMRDKSYISSRKKRLVLVADLFIS